MSIKWRYQTKIMNIRIVKNFHQIILEIIKLRRTKLSNGHHAIPILTLGHPYLIKTRKGL